MGFQHAQQLPDNSCYESDIRMTKQAVGHRQQNVQWPDFLQVIVMHEQARPLIHSRDPPASSQFEC